jgi:hypothetical protein
MTLHVTDLQVNAQSGGEIDITSMSSEVISDPANSRHKMVVPDYDTGISARYGTEVQMEFFAGAEITATNFFDNVGSKRLLKIQMPKSINETGAVGFQILDRTAILTQMSLGGSVGALVKGSATFRISGQHT